MLVQAANTDLFNALVPELTTLSRLKEKFTNFQSRIESQVNQHANTVIHMLQHISIGRVP